MLTCIVKQNIHYFFNQWQLGFGRSSDSSIVHVGDPNLYRLNHFYVHSSFK